MIEKTNHIGFNMIVWREKIKKVIENTCLANGKKQAIIITCDSW